MTKLTTTAKKKSLHFILCSQTYKTKIDVFYIFIRILARYRLYAFIALFIRNKKTLENMLNCFKVSKFVAVTFISFNNEINISYH